MHMKMALYVTKDKSLIHKKLKVSGKNLENTFFKKSVPGISMLS